MNLEVDLVYLLTSGNWKATWMADAIMTIHGNWSLTTHVFGTQWTQMNQSWMTSIQLNNPRKQHVMFVKTLISIGKRSCNEPRAKQAISREEKTNVISVNHHFSNSKTFGG